MALASETARKAAYLFLILCCVAVVGLGGYQLYLDMAPAKVTVPEVPFGLKAGTQFLKGDSPDMRQELSELPLQTQGEIRRATELFRSGAYVQANEIFNAVSLLYPDLVVSLWNETNSLFEIDSLTELENNRLNLLIGKLQGKYPNTGLAKYLESRKTYKSGNKTVALEMAKIAVEQAPALVEARLWYARLLNENNRMPQAVEESRAAISLSAGNEPRGYEVLARLFHDMGTLDSCSSLLDYGLTQYPMDAEMLLLRGYLLEYQGRYDEAEKVYQRILAFRPDFEGAAIALATVGEKTAPGVGGGKISPMDRSQLAWEILEPLVEKYPENMPLREALGLAYLKGRDFDRARIQFREIQSKDPEYPDIQQRIQECNVTRPVLPVQANGLAEDLNRAVDSLRESMAPSTKHDFSTMLGHYLVRYGATPAEFFKKYDIKNFRPVKKNVWQESFYDAPYKHTYTVVFDSLNRFREVHVVVYDSSTTSNHLGLAPEVFTRFLKQNSRISGIGNSTGETDCGDGLVIDAAVWETQDNFEILARVVGTPKEIRMVRFDKSVLPPGLKLCDYSTYLNEF